jgi:hypothetical protein
MKNENHSITEVYKSEESLTEIDFTLREKILGKNWDEKEERYGNIILGDDKNSWKGESYPINIDDVNKVLEKLKKKGCNYVEIMYHSDHIGYYFNGMDIYRSTDEEVLENSKNTEEFEKAKKLAEIDFLQRKIDQIKKTLNK